MLGNESPRVLVSIILYFSSGLRGLFRFGDFDKLSGSELLIEHISCEAIWQHLDGLPFLATSPYIYFSLKVSDIVSRYFSRGRPAPLPEAKERRCPESSKLPQLFLPFLIYRAALQRLAAAMHILIILPTKYARGFYRCLLRQASKARSIRLLPARCDSHDYMAHDASA